MKILFLSHYFYPEGNAPASRVHALAKSWVADGHAVTVITCAPNVPDGVVYQGYCNRWLNEENIDGIKVVRVWTYLAPNKGMTRRILNYLSFMLTATWRSIFVQRPDVLIATSPQFFCGWAGVLSSFLRRVPFVLEIRDLWPESIEAVGALGNKTILRILEKLESLMYRFARVIVTVGDGYRERLIEKGVPKQKIKIIMNGLDADIFHPQASDTDLRDEWKLTGKFICSYCGTIGMACGLDVVIRAAARLRAMGRDDIVFLLIGDGAMRSALEKDSKEKGLSNVVFTGRQPKAPIPAFLSISDVCLIHLRKSEVFTRVMPSKIFEAAGMAKPIINGVSGYAAEFITKAGAGINIEPENSNILIESILRLKANPDDCNAYGKSGYDYVSKNYSRKKLADNYLCVLDSIRGQSFK